MPTLQFKGKNIIWNHHLSVPYHTLEEDKKLNYHPEKGEGNLIIEGDNLIALKSLQPLYSGQIKCIYIDPPYNTGNENWVYNDKVNSPLINEWFGKVVGKDDLTKHDKWLCMMTPRLKLLKEFLHDDGIIFCSIDENEIHNLRLLFNEVFGEDNFIAQLGWQKVYSPKNQSTFFSNDYEFILCYAKNIKNAKINLLPRTEEMNERYKNPDDDDRGDWQSGDLIANEERTDGHYIVKSPKTGKEFDSPQGKHWSFSKEKMLELIRENRIWFGKDGNNFPRIKQFLSEVKDGKKASSLFSFKEFGHTDGAKKELKKLFNELEEAPFDTPKPTKLIKNLVLLGSDENSLILDSFAGTGTTMQSVMEINKESKSNRKCILVQMTEETDDEPNKNVCRDLTRERIKRSIIKNKYKSGFKYFRIGKPIDAESMLEGELPEYKQFAKYVYYLCTGENLNNEKKIKEQEFFVGEYGNQVIYLLYKNDFKELTNLALTLEFSEKILSKNKNKRLVVYAPSCFLDQEYLEDHQIEFVSIPYNLFQRNK